MHKQTLILLLTASCSAVLAADIHKCTIGGKTTYSDQACPKTAVAKPVALYHASGMVSPDRDTVTDTVNRMQDERWVNEAPGRTITRTTTRNGKTATNTIDNPLPVQATRAQPDKTVMCAGYARRIDELDSMARQPQSGATQDWIKSEKAKIQSSMFAAKC